MAYIRTLITLLTIAAIATSCIMQFTMITVKHNLTLKESLLLPKAIHKFASDA